MGNAVAYNPSDAEQREFLAALRAGESGGNYSVGWGNTDLSRAPADQYGFPIWSGKHGPAGNSRAAGAYQFQPGTWRAVAAKYGLNFRNKADQDAGAWYNAQQVYERKTGRSLDTDLDAGRFETVRQALSNEWTSLRDNPRQFLSILGDGVTAEASPGATGTPSFFSSPIQAVSTYFVRGGMILVGALILLVALWALLSKADVLPDAVSVDS